MIDLEAIRKRHEAAVNLARDLQHAQEDQICKRGRHEDDCWQAPV